MATDRKHALVRTAQARELVMKHLNRTDGYLTRGQLLPLVADLGLKTKDLANLLERMATQELINKVEIKHPDYKFGFQAKEGAEIKPIRKAPRRAPKLVDEAPPIDLQANKDGSITVRFNGLVFRVSKEK